MLQYNDLEVVLSRCGVCVVLCTKWEYGSATGPVSHKISF